MASFIEGELMPKLPPEESDRVIEKLEGMKDFDLLKEQIRRIELHKMGLLGTGHLVIVPATGDPVKITLRHRMAYDRLMSLTQAFSPEPVGAS
jgi:hypothetical protein